MPVIETRSTTCDVLCCRREPPLGRMASQNLAEAEGEAKQEQKERGLSVERRL